jgi:putative ABC transport system permease protein
MRRVFRIPFRRPPIEQDIDDELAFHLALREEQLVAQGMSAEEARREALRQFGAVAPIREACITLDHERVKAMNRASALANLRQDFAYALRTLGKNRAFAAMVALTMMLGIGANAAVFSVAYGVLLRPLPYEDAGELVRLWSRNDARGLEFFSVSPADYAVWRERSRAFAAMGAFERQRDAVLTRGNEPQSLQVANVTPDVFALLGAPAFLGRRITENDAQPGAPPVALLSHELWSSRFGSDSSIVGSDLTVDDQKLTVVGVMPTRFAVPGTPAQIWTPLSLTGASPDHANRYLRVLGRLAPGMTVERARAQMDGVAEQLGRELTDTNGEWRVSMMSVPEMIAGRQWRRAVIVLTGVVAFVLLIACANAANLQLARGAVRRREIAVRAALGAGRGRIVTQLLAESAVLAALGGIAGLALAYAGVSLLRTVGGESVPRLDEVRIDGVILGFTLLVTILSGLLFGIIPALSASRTDLGSVLREGSRGAAHGIVGQRTRAALVIAQVALSLVLLVGAGLLMRSFVRLQRVDVGFDPTGVRLASIRLPDARYPDTARYEAFYSTLLDRVRQMPGVQSAALASSAPFAGPNTGMIFSIPEKPLAPGEPAPDADYRTVSPGYFRTMRIRLLRGRDFTAADRRGASEVAVISEVAARSYWPGVDPLGRQLEIGSGERAKRLTIVGIVRDARYFGLENPEVRPMIYFSALARPQRAMAMVVHGDGNASFVTRLRETVRDIDPQLPVGTVDSMERLVRQALATQRFALVLFAIFALTALVLAAIGIYGVLSYLVRQRTHELGIRVALGASPSTLVRSVLGGALRVAIPGIILGVVVALALTRLLASLLFGVSTTDMATFAGVSLLLVVTAVIASVIPARRATKADPMLALRGDL